MINTKYFSTYFTELLNTYGESREKYFKIFADEGELKKAVKQYGKQPQQFTNGIVEVLSSALTPIRGIRLNTYTLQLTMFVDLAMNGVNADKESYNLMAIRDIISEIIDENNGSTNIVEIDGTSYSVSMTMNYPTDGTKTDVGYISDCLPLYWTINFAMFQDGINANNCKLIVNNVELPFTRLVLTRKRTAEQSTFSGDSSSKTIMQMNGLSLDVVMPALSNNAVSNLIMTDVLSGGNYALNVRLETPVLNINFIGTFGDTVASLDIATNIGFNFSIVEGQPNVLDFSSDNKWSSSTATGSTGSVTSTKKVTIYWGDGSSQYVNAGTYTHQYTDDRTAHTIRTYGG